MVVTRTEDGKGGVEIYLKPRGPLFTSTRFREIPLNSRTATSHHVECSIPKFTGTFEPMLKLPDSFELPDGCALHIQVDMQIPSSTGLSGTYSRVCGVRYPESGIFSAKPWSEDHICLTTDGFKSAISQDLTKVRRLKLHCSHTRSGTMLVTVTRIHGKWRDGRADRYGPRGPREHRRGFGNSHVPLDGELGEPFEFVYRPLAKAAQNCTQTPPPDVLYPDFPGFTRDLNYVADRQAAHLKFTELCRAWDAKQAEISAGPSLVQSSQPAPAADAVQTPLTSPAAVHQALSISHQETAPEVLAGILGAVRQGAPAPKRAKRDKPAICTCPTEHHTTPRRPQKFRDTEISSDGDSPAVQPKQSFRPRKAEKTKETPEFEPPEASKESATVACGQCKQIKKAPRGKKIAFRNARRRYMYVPQSAPDDDDLEDEAPNNHVQQVDEDDEEAPPQEDRKVMETLRSSSDTPGLGSPDVPMSDSGVVPQPGTDGPGTQTQESTVSERGLNPTTETSATGEADVVVMPQVTVGDSEMTEPTATTESTVASEENETQSNTVSENGVAPEPRYEEHEGATETPAADRTVAQQEAAEPPEVTNDDTSANGPAPTEPPTVTPAAGGVDSRKRNATPANEERELKRQRIDIDLTNDKDQDEHVKPITQDSKASIVLDDNNEQDELEARLKKVMLQQKQLELQLEEAELRQKLKKLTQRKGGAPLKRQEAVKIEIEIEID